jgi:hypothetical protein
MTLKLLRPGWAVLIAMTPAAPAILAQDTGTSAIKRTFVDGCPATRARM